MLKESGKGVDMYILDTGIRITHNQLGYINKPRNFRKNYVDEDFVSWHTGRDTDLFNLCVGRHRGTRN